MGITGSSQIENKFFGFRLYKIFENGPLAESSLTILDNFIIPPEEVIQNQISFSEYIKKNLNKKVNLQIYSVIKRFFYTIEVTPRNDWGNEKSGFLGACVRYENWSTAHTNTLRAIKVKGDSVSEMILKLVPFEDFIISIRPENKDFITLNQEASDPLTIFQEVLQDNIENFIEVFIYNVKTGPRSVKLFLEQKNGEMLGCDVAYGKLHELPIIHNEETDKDLVFKNPEEYVKDSDYKNDNKKDDFVLEETKKILFGNLNRSKSNSGENVIKNNKSIIGDKAQENVDNSVNIKEETEENKIEIVPRNKIEQENLNIDIYSENIIIDKAATLEKNESEENKVENSKKIELAMENNIEENKVNEKIEPINNNVNNYEYENKKDNNLNEKVDDIEILNTQE